MEVPDNTPRRDRRPIHLVVAIHGIMTGRSDPTWPERFAVYAETHHDRIAVLTDHYRAGPFPRLNWFLGNPRHARVIARQIEVWRKKARVESIAFVGHSNGCDIARRAIRELTRHGVRIDHAVLVSAPLGRTAERLGLRDALDCGQLGRLTAYVGRRDRVLGPRWNWTSPMTWIGRLIRWPYGSLGRLGFRRPDETLYGVKEPEPESKIVERIFPERAHGDFFPRHADQVSERTFTNIFLDLHPDAKNLPTCKHDDISN